METWKTCQGQGVLVQRCVIWKGVLLKRCGIEKVCCGKGGLFYKRCVTVKYLIFLKVCYLPKYVKLHTLGNEKVWYPKVCKLKECFSAAHHSPWCVNFSCQDYFSLSFVQEIKS